MSYVFHKADTTNFNNHVFVLIKYAFPEGM